MSQARRVAQQYQDADPESFGRPPRYTRPRTKERPDYSDAVIGTVVTIDRGRYTCVLPDDVTVIAAKARQLGRKGVIVGDRVRLVGDLSGDAGTLARIVTVEPRATVLRRTADDNDPHERPIVANADQLLIVTALADPPPRTGMIDRILIAAYEAGIHPILCLTKADLGSPEEIISYYAPLDVHIVVTAMGHDTSEITELLSGHTTVFVGHSGVGKSTLVNSIIPDANLATGAVNDVTGRGRHTSTAAVALRLPNGDGWVIDTPGVRSFGLNHVTPATVVAVFSDFADFVDDCPRSCPHTADAPECALDQAVADGVLSADRLASFRRIVNVLVDPDHQAS